MSDIDTNQEKVTFKLILKRGNKSIQAERAERIGERAKNAYNAILVEKKEVVMDIQEELEAMADISTSNSLNSGNAIKGTTFDAKAFVKKRSDLKLRLVLAEQNLKVVQEDKDFYS